MIPIDCKIPNFLVCFFMSSAYPFKRKNVYHDHSQFHYSWCVPSYYFADNLLASMLHIHSFFSPLCSTTNGKQHKSIKLQSIQQLRKIQNLWSSKRMPKLSIKKRVCRSITAHHYALFPATLGNLCSCGERNGAQRRTKVFHDASIGTVVIGENAHCSKLIFLSKHLQHI